MSCKIAGIYVKIVYLPAGCSSKFIKIVFSSSSGILVLLLKPFQATALETDVTSFGITVCLSLKFKTVILSLETVDPAR